MKVTTIRTPDGGSREFLEISDLEKEAEIRKQFTNVRFLVPGWVFTMEFKLGRTNVQLNRQGVITDVYPG